MQYALQTKDVTDQLQKAITEIRHQLGSNIEVMLPVKLPGRDTPEKAMVDISQLLAKLAEDWFPYSAKYRT